MKKLLVIITLAIIVGLGYWGVTLWLEAERNYVPIDEFQLAYQAISENEEAQYEPSNLSSNTKNTSLSSSYDIEETVRIMNGMELAQAHSSSFSDFLTYMAKQDYSRVAKDVIEAKRMLFPIMQEMYLLQEKLNDYNAAWMLMRSLARGAVSNVNNTIAMASSVDINEIANHSIDICTIYYNEYQNELQEKRSLERRLLRVMNNYIMYIEAYTPIYHKYMKEWDALCLSKDKAYIDISEGQYVEALNAAEKVLEQSHDNREGLILKIISLINIGDSVAAEEATFNTGDETPQMANQYWIDAQKQIDHYLSMYPERSAPALLLSGILQSSMGNNGKAISLFNQSAIEYPRQAEQLTDMLDSYRFRSYLNKTVEGGLLLGMYYSTMAGYGSFSPNFQKAKLHLLNGDSQRSMMEIHNHFFRRSNQDVFDGLLSDLIFCENILYDSFSSMFEDKSYIDVEFQPSSRMMFGKKDDSIDVGIINRSDHELKNVRVYLCLNYTEMRSDDYVIKRLPNAKSSIAPFESSIISSYKLSDDNRKLSDIVKVRAIVLTEDSVAWIEREEDKIKSINKERTSIAMAIEQADEALIIEWEKFRGDFEAFLRDNTMVSTTGNDLMGKVFSMLSLQSGTQGSSALSADYFLSTELGSEWKASSLKIDLPREVASVEPYFSIGSYNEIDNHIMPNAHILLGDNIKLGFDYNVDSMDAFPLYIWSKGANFVVIITRQGDEWRVESVEYI